jgi:4-hydroxybenzoate polyprenyltransferase
MKFLKIIRIQNLIMLALLQFIIRFVFLKNQNVSLALANWQFCLLILSTLCIAAGGYIINDIFDQETDEVNNPKTRIVGVSISESFAYNLYVGFTIIGVCIGFYLSNVILRPSFATVFIVLASLLYFYATSLKQTLLIGNIIVAFVLSFSIIIIALFDMFPSIDPENKPRMAVLFGIMLDYAIFAFMINFLREIVKDLEDEIGDKSQLMNTLPIVIGITKTSKFIAILSLIPIVLVSNYVYQYFFKNNLLVCTLFGMFTIIAPLIYFASKIWFAKSKQDFKHLSLILKIILFFGIISIALISFTIKNHA